jgi:hypothetical protein
MERWIKHAQIILTLKRISKQLVSMDHGMFILLNKTAIKCSKLTHLKQPNNLLPPNIQNIRTDQRAATSRAENINQDLD